MTTRGHQREIARAAAFTLIEMVVVVAVISILLTAGIRLLGNTGAQSRRVAVDQVLAAVEQARTTAISSRTTIFLALAEPGDLPVEDSRCRIGLFRVPEWEPGAGRLDAILLRRWEALPAGLVLIGGNAGALRNPLDQPELTIRYGEDGHAAEGRFHGIAFHPRGGLSWPEGSDPMVLRIAEGAYRSGAPVAVRRGGKDLIAEDQLKIGRVIARPYRNH